MTLYEAQNRPLLSDLKAARAANLPPTVLIPAWGWAGRQTFDELGQTMLSQSVYTEVDIQLVRGYQYYLDNSCPKCGIPAWYGHSEHNEVHFEVKSATCYSCAEVELYYREVHGKKSDGERDGVTPFVTLAPILGEDKEVLIPIPSPESAAARLPRR